MRPLGLLLIACAAAIAPAAAAAQAIARSAGPQKVSVTIYRAPYRGSGEAMNLAWLNGYALISETRQVAIPAGEADIRFEGVAGGIFPQSAIVAGLPGFVVEKNQDALLLSPASLVDASLGKRVQLRRTSRATGAVREMEAVVRSGPDGAVVIETADGIEALRCNGLAETLVYDRVPPRLSAKPTLSVRVRSARATRATVTLSYLASDFDWQANYVARLSPEGDRMDLFAWLTLANGDETSFVRADTQAVAGQINRQAIRADRPKAPPLELRCWPAGTTTSDLVEEQPEREEAISIISSPPAMAPPPPPPPPPLAPPPPPMMARQEDLGDLKLYRIPQPVTVASHGQKQVALLSRSGIRVETLYRSQIYGWQPGVPQPAMRIVKTRNSVSQGLGLPLPSGSVAMFSESRERPLLLGRGAIDDKAVDEDVEIAFGRATAISVAARPLSPTNAKAADWELTASNARPVPVQFELLFSDGGVKLIPGEPLARRNGQALWAVTIPANGQAILRYRVEKP